MESRNQEIRESENHEITIPIAVHLHCETRTVEDIEGAAKAKQMALTKFPSWVKINYVRRIRELDCFESVREMLLAGTPVLEMARWIQEHGEETRIGLNTLQTYLEHYRATIPSWLMAARQQPKQYLELKKTADDTINVLQELTRLYKWMQERLEIGMNQERKFGILSTGMDRNFVVASQLLQVINELKDKLGVNDDQARAAMPKSLSDQVQWNRIYSRQSVQEVMSSPEKRARVIQTAERLLDLYSNKLNVETLDKIKRSKEVEAAHSISSDEVV